MDGKGKGPKPRGVGAAAFIVESGFRELAPRLQLITKIPLEWVPPVPNVQSFFDVGPVHLDRGKENYQSHLSAGWSM